MSRRGMWGALFGAQERDRFSAEELRHLHGVLLRNQVVTDANRDVVVEALRSIAELVIWCVPQTHYFGTFSPLGW